MNSISADNEAQKQLVTELSATGSAMMFSRVIGEI